MKAYKSISNKVKIERKNGIFLTKCTANCNLVKLAITLPTLTLSKTNITFFFREVYRYREKKAKSVKQPYS